MRPFFVFLIAFIPILPAFGDEEPDRRSVVVAAVSYVDGAYNSMDSVKQDKLTQQNVVQSGSGPIVTSVSAQDGTVTVTKSEVTIPVGGTTSDTRATLWLE